jgi:hypothetical protein
MLKILESYSFTPKEINNYILEKKILNFDFDIKKLNEEKYHTIKD